MCVSDFVLRLKYLFLLIVLLAATAVVGLRDLSIGTDTLNYASNFLSVQSCNCFPGRLEPGFQVFTWLLGLTGLGTGFYFFSISLLIFVVAYSLSRKIGNLLGGSDIEQWKVRYWILIFLFVSPFFVSANINTVRQGLASLFVFFAMFSLIEHKWRSFCFYSILGISFHYFSSVLVLLSLMLFFPLYLLLMVTVVLSVVYGFGFSEAIVKFVSDQTGFGIYSFIVDYVAGAEYRSGVRLDFLMFSWFWMVLFLVGSIFLVEPERRHGFRILIKIYLVLLIPFLLFGFGNYSNRYVYTAWLFLSIAMGGLVGSLRFSLVGSRLILPVLLLASCLIFIGMVNYGFAY
nr:EpsG family protein [uncultured Pseudomonas sp.]